MVVVFLHQAVILLHKTLINKRVTKKKRRSDDRRFDII
jgi:hypothetical protein